MNPLTETIKHAAVKSESGWIFIGKRHADCFYKAHNINVKMAKGADAQGFVTSQGRFVSRVEAALIADKEKQTDEYKGKLFSEDLWCERDGGKFDYCEIKGYYLKTPPDHAETRNEE